MRSIDIKKDLGLILIGFALYQMIYAHWSSRSSIIGIEGNNFGIVKAIFLTILTRVLAESIKLSSIYFNYRHLKRRKIVSFGFKGYKTYISCCLIVWFFVGGREAFLLWTAHYLIGVGSMQKGAIVATGDYLGKLRGRVVTDKS